jgi:hypothetical protein
MPGLYDNEAQQYIEEEHCMEGDWYVDDDGFLYIVPYPPDTVAEIEGFDGPVLDALNAACRENDGVVPDSVVDALGLACVPHVLKRFSPEDGYYYT